MFKEAAVLAGLVFAGGYVAGAFGPQHYARTVARPQAEVMAALADLDVTAQPGAPGSTAAAAGGVRPLFRLEKAADHMTWYVMSGDKVATAMTATFTPADDGKATRVTTDVHRGDAPDDFVSPAFRSEGITAGLFGMAVEDELNKLVAPPRADAATCQALLDRLTDDNLAASETQSRASAERGDGGRIAGMFGDHAKLAMRLGAQEAELRRAGCANPGAGADFTPASDTMR